MLPYDYVMCLIISFCPYIWRTVMDPRVEAVQQRKKSIDKQVDLDGKKKVMLYYMLVIVLVSYLLFRSF